MKTIFKKKNKKTSGLCDIFLKICLCDHPEFARMRLEAVNKIILSDCPLPSNAKIYKDKQEILFMMTDR